MSNDEMKLSVMKLYKVGRILMCSPMHDINNAAILAHLQLKYHLRNNIASAGQFFPFSVQNILDIQNIK